MSQNASTNQKKSQIAPIMCNQFEISKYSYSELEKDNERNTAQMISYPRYDHPKVGEFSFIFQTPEIEITSYGLPRKDEKWYKEDHQRSFLKVPLDDSQESCVQLRKMLEQIDNYTDSNRKEILGKYSSSKLNFRYQPIVREPQTTDDLELIEDDEGKKEASAKPRPKYCKFRFDTEYPSRNIRTAFYVKNTDPKASKKIEQKSLKTATELEDYLTWGSKVRMIVMANKLWAAKKQR